RYGAVLLAGAAIPMAAQAISALVQAGGTPSPAAFGISSAQASRLGLTISAGLTPAFWIYCLFLVALIVSCIWMLFPPPAAAAPATVVAAGAGAKDRNDPAPAPGHVDGEASAESPDGAAPPELETAPSGTVPSGTA